MSEIIIVILIAYIAVATVTVFLHLVYYVVNSRFELSVESEKKRWIKKIEKMKKKKNYLLNWYWLHKLNKERGVRSFARAIIEKSADEIFINNQDKIIKMAYRVKSETDRAFVSYLIYSIPTDSAKLLKTFDKVMFYYIENSKSIFTITNSILALSRISDENGMIKVFSIINKQKIIVNEKVLLDVLRKLSIVSESLDEKLLQNFRSYNQHYQNVVINYMIATKNYRFNSILRNYYLKIEDSFINMDTKCNILRLLELEFNLSNVRVFLNAVNLHSNDVLWSFSAVSATALGSQYKIYLENLKDSLSLKMDNPMNIWSEVKTTLKKSLTSRHWYVRLNSARTLSILGMKDSDVADVLNSGDKYGNEMMMYNFKKTTLNTMDIPS